MTNKPRMWTSANILFIGGLVTLAATYIATLITDKENKIERDELRKKLDSSQSEVIKLTQELRNVVTGGEGYCYVNIFPEEPNKAGIFLTSDSKYPLYDIKIVVRTWATSDWPTPESSENGKKLTNPYPSQSFSVDVLPAYNSEQQNDMKPLGSVVFNNKRSWVYSIDFSARNGNWKQVYEMSLGKDSTPIISHIIYKMKIENNGYTQVVMKESINPKASKSILKSFEKKFIPFVNFKK